MMERLKLFTDMLLSDKAQEMNKLANEHFEDLLSGGSHEGSHKIEKALKIQGFW